MSNAARSRQGIALLWLLTLLLIWLAAAPAVAGSKIVLASVGGSPDWLLGILQPLGLDPLAGERAGWTYYLPLMLSAALWAWVVALAPVIGVRNLLIASFLLIVVCLLAPPLLSQDVFSYIAYARLGVVHDLNPYAYRPFDIPLDPVFGYAGSKDAVNVYGPFFTIASYPLAWLSVPLAFWILKVVAACSTGGLLLIVRSLAERVGADPARAVALLGLSPATLIHVVAGAHNEAVVMLIVFAGVHMTLAKADGSREALGGFVSALAVGVKASAAVPLVFMLAAARRRLAMFCAMAGAGVLTVLAAFIGFGSDALGGLNLISSNQDRSSRWSLPHKTVDALAQVFGGLDVAAAMDVVRLIFVLALALLVVYLLLRSFRQPETWLANAGWATLGVLCATAWLVPWYLLWLLPFAAVGRDARLQVASIIFCAWTLVIAIPF